MLLTEKLRKALPDIHPEGDGRKTPRNPHIHACFVNDKQNAAFYVAEGQPHGIDYLFWGFMVKQSVYPFALRVSITLSKLEKGDWLGNSPAIEDTKFTPRMWIDIYNDLFGHETESAKTQSRFYG